MYELVDRLDLLAADLITESDDRQRATALVAMVRLGGGRAVEALLQLARLIGEASDPSEALSQVRALGMDDEASAIVLVVIACFAAVRLDHIARQDATATRSVITAMAERAYLVIGANGPDVMAWVVSLVGVTVRHLSAEAASRVPLVRVETGISLPSSLIAWDLYGNPARGGEIVSRNASGTALLMPVAFEALGS